MSKKSVIQFTARGLEDWRKWLKRNHQKKDSVFLVRYKKFTGKSTYTHLQAMKEAICFGWIDTTVKRVDEERYGHTFVRRKESARWSRNTLSYAQEMVREGKMEPAGLEAYERGKKKPVIDSDLPKNPDPPEDLVHELKENEKAEEFFQKLTPTQRRYYCVWIDRAKRPETRQSRIRKTVSNCENGLKLWEKKE